MQIEIKENLSLELHGFSGTTLEKDYVGTAFKLMDKMWQVVKGNNLPNRGLNVWVYEPNEVVFAGVELLEVPHSDTGLEHKSIVLEKYAYYKHIGSYDLIKSVGQKMREELKDQGFTIAGPYVEIYGHWQEDGSKLETELVMGVR